MTFSEPKNERIETRKGTVVFNDQQEIAGLQFEVYKRLRFESASEYEMIPTEDTVFKIWLEYPSITAEIGYRDHVIIHYFDSPELIDVLYTYPQFTINNMIYTPNMTTSNAPEL